MTKLIWINNDNLKTGMRGYKPVWISSNLPKTPKIKSQRITKRKWGNRTMVEKPILR